MGRTIGTSHGVRLERTGEQAEAEDVWSNVWSHVWPFQIHQLCMLSNDDDEATESRPVRAIKDIQPGKHSINSIQPTQSSVSSPSARPAWVSSPSARPAALTVGKTSQNEAKMRRSSRNLRTMSVEAWKCHGTPPGTALARLVEKKIGGLQENTKRYTPPKTPLVNEKVMENPVWSPKWASLSPSDAAELKRIERDLDILKDPQKNSTLIKVLSPQAYAADERPGVFQGNNTKLFLSPERVKKTMAELKI